MLLVMNIFMKQKYEWSLSKWGGVHMKKIILGFILVLVIGNIQAVYGNEGFVAPIGYYEIKELNGGSQYAVNMSENGLYCVIDENNNMLADYKYKDIVAYNGIVYGMLPGKDGKVDYYTIDSSGEHYYKTMDGYAFDDGYGYIGYYVKIKLANNKVRTRYGIVDGRLNVIVEPLYDNKIIFDDDGYAVVYKGSTSINYRYTDTSHEHYISAIEYKDSERVYLKKDGDKIIKVEKGDEPIVYRPVAGSVIAPINPPELIRIIAILKAIEVVAIWVAIRCIWWLLKRKKCEKQD